MFRKEEVERILKQARRMDPQMEMFGVSQHQYRLRPPVDLAFVRATEEKYCFQFPQDYVQFITQVGNGGAGPGYGLYSFQFPYTEEKNSRDAKMRDAYLCRLSQELRLLPMKPSELEQWSVSEEEYKQNPQKYFVCDAGSYDWDNDVPYGFFRLGTHGCALDYGLVTAGERYGQVFTSGIEGDFELEAGSFREFYQDWLAFLADTERFQSVLDMWRKVRSR